MSELAQIELQVEIESSTESFIQIIRSKQYLFPKICPHVVKDLKIIEGDWGMDGSIQEWLYVAGDAETMSDRVEVIHGRNTALTFKVVDGTSMKYYKSMKTTIEVTEKGDGKGGLVKWTAEYEKLNDHIPPPNKYLDVCLAFTKSIDAYLAKTS